MLTSNQQALIAMQNAISGFAIKIAAFMNAAGQEVHVEPQNPAGVPQETVDLRIKLIEEEVNKELIPALRAGNFEEIADGIADVLYVVIGTALTYGIPVGLTFDAVHDNNMTKVNPETGQCTRDENGKVLKPEGFKTVDLLTPLQAWDEAIRSMGGDVAFRTLVLDGYMKYYRSKMAGQTTIATRDNPNPEQLNALGRVLETN